MAGEPDTLRNHSGLRIRGPLLSRVPFQSARGLAHSKSWREFRVGSTNACRLGLRQPSAAFPSAVGATYSAREDARPTKDDFAPTELGIFQFRFSTTMPALTGLGLETQFALICEIRVTPFLLLPLDQRFHHGGVGQCGDVANLVGLVFGNLAQDTPHDFA